MDISIVKERYSSYGSALREYPCTCGSIMYLIREDEKLELDYEIWRNQPFQYVWMCPACKRALSVYSQSSDVTVTEEWIDFPHTRKRTVSPVAIVLSGTL